MADVRSVIDTATGEVVITVTLKLCCLISNSNTVEANMQSGESSQSACCEECGCQSACCGRPMTKQTHTL